MLHFQFARRICFSLFSLQDNTATFIIDLLICVLDSLAHEGKVMLSEIQVDKLNDKGV